MNNGEVRGVAEEAPANKNAVLEFIPTEPPGAYRIRGIQANLYLAMDAKGKLYGESDRTEGSTIFAEHTQNKVRNTQWYTRSRNFRPKRKVFSFRFRPPKLKAEYGRNSKALDFLLFVHENIANVNYQC